MIKADRNEIELASKLKLDLVLDGRVGAGDYI